MNTEQLRTFTGMTLRQSHHWQTRGWLRPTNPDCGTGRTLEFTADEARTAGRMVRLVAAGLTPAAAHRVARGQHELAPGIVVHIDQPDLVDA